jgi:hypothetical protein
MGRNSLLLAPEPLNSGAPKGAPLSYKKNRENLFSLFFHFLLDFVGGLWYSLNIKGTQ